MSRYGFAPCSCGSSMLKPTLRPPPSLQPRFAASITPGPPPVITAQPASPKSFAVARAAAYSGESSRIRAEPKIEHGGPVDPLDRLEPAVELLRDLRGVLAQLVLVLMRLVEKLPVLHGYRPPPLGRVASIPITSSAASPR